MQSIDIPQLTKELNSLAEVFEKKPLSEKAAGVWFDTLKEFPTERVLGLLINWPKSHTKFPAPSELWKVCSELGSSEIERKAALDKQPPAWERSAKGAEFLAKMKAMLNKPSRTPRQHWEHVYATQRPGDIGYEYAKKILKREDREPGSDAEEANF
jgi:hypothetical protein